ncbi:MAG: YihY/virulence factor BrkB family protein [Betaproteobacteria bacterium]|nr:YihY/virulence factor BrkB family protein [Betaproteobacteria bacterium]
MRRYVSPAVEIARHPWPFVVEVFREFGRNHGLLLAGAVAYYMLLSILPLLILLLVVLSNVLDPDALLATLARYLDLVVPGHTKNIIDDLAGFLRHRAAVSGVILLTILFFSSLAFGVLQNAFAVIFHHRRRERPRSWLASALIPYAFIVVLAIGMVVITIVSGALQTLAVREFHAFGELRSFGVLSVWFIYLTGIAGEILLLTAIYLVMPAGQLRLRHALIGGIVAGLLWEVTRHVLVWYFSTLSQIGVVYGSFATTIALLLSFEIAATVLLLGAQVIAIYERRLKHASGALPQPPL